MLVVTKYSELDGISFFLQCLVLILVVYITRYLFTFNFRFPNIDTHSLHSAASDPVFLSYGLYTLHEAI